MYGLCKSSCASKLRRRLREKNFTERNESNRFNERSTPVDPGNAIHFQTETAHSLQRKGNLIDWQQNMVSELSPATSTLPMGTVCPIGSKAVISATEFDSKIEKRGMDDSSLRAEQWFKDEMVNQAFLPTYEKNAGLFQQEIKTNFLNENNAITSVEHYFKQKSKIVPQTIFDEQLPSKNSRHDELTCTGLLATENPYNGLWKGNDQDGKNKIADVMTTFKVDFLNEQIDDRYQLIDDQCKHTTGSEQWSNLLLLAAKNWSEEDDPFEPVPI
jgi:hypothetical protein